MHFVREKTLLEAIASSLTELFSPVIISERVSGMLASYDFVTRETLVLFRQAPAAGAARCRFRARLREAPCAHARRPAGGAGRARIQVRRAVVDARRPASSPMWRPGIFRRARSCRTNMSDASHAIHRAAAAAARRAPDRITKRRAAGCCWRPSACSRPTDRGGDPQALHRRGDVRRNRRRSRQDLQRAARAHRRPT